MARTTRTVIDIDLDEELAEILARPVEDTSVAVKLFGETFTLRQSTNSFRSLGAASGDVTALRDFMVDMVVADDRDRFVDTLNAQDNLPAEALGRVLSRMVEAVADRPTNSSSASSPGGRRTTGGTKLKGV